MANEKSTDISIEGQPDPNRRIVAVCSGGHGSQGGKSRRKQANGCGKNIHSHDGGKLDSE